MTEQRFPSQIPPIGQKVRITELSSQKPPIEAIITDRKTDWKTDYIYFVYINGNKTPFLTYRSDSNKWFIFPGIGCKVEVIP